MKAALFKITALGLFSAFTLQAAAQRTTIDKVDDPWKDYPSKEALYNDYSRWSVGVNVGMPFWAGDFRSAGRGNGNWGYMFGVQGGYQISPIFGVRLSLDYGQNKAGAQRQERNFALKPDGHAFYYEGGVGTTSDAYLASQGYKRYRDLYSSISLLNLGANLEVNLLNLFRRSDGDRRWAVIAAPGIYAQKFSPTVKSRSDDSRFADKINSHINLGLGGDVAVRYRINEQFDVQAKGGMIWINNGNFDGISAIGKGHRNTMITAQVGVVWKIGNGVGGKKDNLMYAPGYLPMWKRATKTVYRTVYKTVHDTIYIDRKVLEKSPDVAVVEGLQHMPAIYFQRGKWRLDTDKYARQLFTIAQALKNNPDVDINIYGYADFTGGKAINDKITRKRAEALKRWLVRVGIDGDRIQTYGLGKDRTIDRKLRYTIKARRTEVKGKE